MSGGTHGGGSAPKPLKVVVLLDTVGGGGTERSTISTLDGLRREGIEPQLVTLVAAEPRHRRWVDDQGLTVTELGSRRVDVAVRRLRRLLRQQRPDVVHASLFNATMVARLAAVGTGIPVVVSVVNTAYADARLRHPDLNRRKVAVVKGLERALSVVTARYHAVSEGVAAHTIRHLRVPAEKVTVAERGRDPGRFATQVSAAEIAATRAELGVSPEQVLVLGVGRIEFLKSWETLAAAIGQLPPKFVAAIAGIELSPKAGAALDDAIERSGAHQRVIRLGERDDVPRLMAAADMLVVASRSEGTAGVTLEAMGSGLPIVATDVEGLRGVLEDGHNALVVPIENPAAMAAAVQRVADEPGLGGALAAAGREEFESRFTLAAANRRMADLYRSVAAQGRRRQR